MEAQLATEKDFTSSIFKKKKKTTNKHQLYDKQVFLDSSLLAQKTLLDQPQ